MAQMLLLYLFLLLQHANAIVNLNFQLNRSKIYPGKNLVLEVGVETTEPIYYVSLHLFLPAELKFKASVISESCSNSCNATLPPNTILPVFTLTDFHFDKVKIATVSQLILYSNQNLTWDPGTLRKMTIELRQVTANRFVENEFVIALLKFWNQESSEDNVFLPDAATQKFSRKWFKLVPIEIMTLIDGLPYTAGEEIYKIHPNDATYVSLIAKAEFSAFPIKFLLDLPFRNETKEVCKGKLLDGTGYGCQIEIERVPLIRTLSGKFEMTLRNGATLTKLVSFTDSSTQIEILAQKDHVTYCLDPCQVNLTVRFEPSRENVPSGTELWVLSKGFYGRNLELCEQAEPRMILLIGPGLELEVTAVPDAQLEAFSRTKVNVLLAHSESSSENLRILKLNLLLPNTSSEYIQGSCKISRNVPTDTQPRCDESQLSGDNGLELGFLALNDTISIEFELELTQDALVSSKIFIIASAVFAFDSIHLTTCLPEPCKNGGVCQRISASDNRCICSTNFYGDDCSKVHCPYGWYHPPSLSSCYYFPGKQLNFIEAEKECDKFGATLAVFDNGQEKSAVNNYVYNILGKSMKIWLGQGKWVIPKDTNKVRNSCTMTETDSTSNTSGSCDEKLYFICIIKINKGTGETFTRREVSELSTKPLIYESFDLGLGETLSVHQTLTTTIQFLLPLGTLRNMALDTSFHSAEINPMPINFISSELMVPSHLRVSSPDNLRINNSQQLATHLIKTRRKREQPAMSFRIFRKVGDIVNVNESGARIIFKTTFIATGEGKGFSGSHFRMESNLLLNGERYLVGSRESMFAEPLLRMEKSVYPVPEMSAGISKVRVRIIHDSKSTGPAHNVLFEDDIHSMQLVHDPEQFVALSTQTRIRLKRDTLPVNESMEIEYLIRMTRDLPSTTYRNATANYSSLKPGELVFPDYPGKVGQLEVSTCLIRQEDVVEIEKYHDHKVSSASFTITFLAGLLIFLILLAMWYFRKRNTNTVVPDDEEQLLREQQTPALLERNEVAIMTELPSTSQDENLIQALSHENQQDTIRLLDKQSVKQCANMDNNLRAERLQTMVDAAVSVMADQGQDMGKKLKKRVDTAMGKVDQQFETAETDLVQKLKKGNSKSTQHLRKSQKLEREQVEASTSVENPEVSAILHQQHSVEMDNLMYKLQLEQDLAIQNLKSEFEAKKETVVEEIQAQLTAELVESGKLDEEAAENLREEMSKMSQDISMWYDAETARQKALLEHRYNLRKSLAMRKDLSHKQRKELFNKMIEQHFSTIEALESQGLITSQESKIMKENFRKEMAKLEKWFDCERKKGEKQLQSNLAKEKRQKMAQIKNRHELELKELEKRYKENKMSLDPIDLLQERQKLLSEQREELLRLEGGLDQDGARELDMLHQRLATEVKDRLQTMKDKIIKDKGLTGQQADALLQFQNSELKELEKQQNRVKSVESERREVELKQKQKQLKKQIQKEIEEQKTLRDHEASVFKHLLNQQSALSDQEREELLRLNRENGAQLQTNLTVYKLTQLTLIEQKISQRRASILEKVQKQNLRKTGSGESRSDGGVTTKEDTQEHLEMIKKSAQDKLDTLRKTSLVTEEQMKEVEEEMLEKRAKRVRKRENRLGKMLASLQMDKSKQISQLANQEDALESLTSCMVNDLTDRGILTNPDCHRILERHQSEQKLLQDKLNEQRNKQEMVLQQRLEERLLKRKSVVINSQNERAKTATNRPFSSKVSRSIADFNLILEQSKEREQIVQNLENEFDQRFLEDKEQFLITKQKALQDQEMEFIRSLAESGNFKSSEITGVLRMVFPQKSRTEVKSIVNQLIQIDSETSSTLESRPHSTTLDKKYEAEEEKKIFMQKRLPASRKAREAEKRPRTALPPIYHRPEPLGASVEEITEYLPPKRLATRRVSTTFHK